ncbi:ribonuclease R [Mycoplasmopsis californica HAZ160_1]|uniref:Ribonuclease R n=1 Tax=Mycoplasmopsis californica HAZ160_1 TaxID=1397850 RepID=A0AAT9F8I6_9BACT|nr:ribonuclease R [Mycoplasmopsis californica]BAP01202.1 ribonuclease R [Mycoplasmopsis californica HAZ160_1]BBG41073.1 ribonuclease R [Mycoplasmopsis californica]BBG41666.1 ribonuclease R [Mycoplasmopsis californica]BBG42260.1 ribonuclease R [Mycoplasmopsis californica]BBG42837.1 ribonuclease R [Mycoplasmopsis californica]
MISIEKIYNYIKAKKRCNYLSIAKGLQVPYNKSKQLTIALKEMVEKHKIILFRDNTYSILVPKGTIEGVIKYSKDARFGFIDLDEENDGEKVSYFVPGSSFNNAYTGDFVKAEVYEYFENSSLKVFAHITEVIKRKEAKIPGIIELNNSVITFKPIKNDYANTRFVINEFKIDARLDDLVLAKICAWKQNELHVDIVEKVSNISDPLCYVKSLLAEREMPKGFEKEVQKEADLIPDKIDPKGMKNRVDFRDELIVTIDGENTKDFDDAISVKKINNSYYELAVHIADVSYYVHENSEIDKEALKRGTSTYLANKVIPMLPEKLSNGICSLNPNEDRFTMSIIINIDNNGHTMDARLVQGVINSKYRLTYKRVNEFIESKKRFEDQSLNKMLNLAWELTQKIRKVKLSEGYIDFEIEEPKIILGDKDQVVDVIVDSSGPSERMIEDFMVRANEETAKILTKAKIPVMYRIHDVPSEEKILTFKQVMNALNIKIELDSMNLTPLSFQQAIEKIKKQRFDSFLQIMFLRTMSKAVYNPENIGHFGLASEHYCHFTSPIRRYPDLMVHRAIRDVLINNDRTKIEHMRKILPTISEMNSEAEQKALQIERDTNDLLYAEYFRNKIGQSFNCQIVSVLKFGMFVEFENKTNALVHISTLSDDEYEINDDSTAIIGKNTKNKYRLGDKVAVVILKSDPINGKVDACLVKNYSDYFSNIKQNLKQRSKNSKK